MAGSSSSSSVVELYTAAELDTATSAIFFRDDRAAEGTTDDSSWPEAEKTISKLRTSQVALRALCNMYKIPADHTPVIADGCAACRTPPAASDAICVYAQALEAGLRLPLHDFYVAVLRHLGLAPSQLAPNAWRYLAGFVLLCEDAGVEPLLSAFFFFFSVCAHKGDSFGWHHFKSYAMSRGSGDRRQRRLFTGRMPRFADWKSVFFFLRSPPTTPWQCSVRWGKPTREAVRAPVVSTAMKTAIRKLLVRAGSSGIDVMQFLSGRNLPVGRHAAGALSPRQTVKVEATAAGCAPTRKRKSPEIAAPVVGVAAFDSPQCFDGTGTSTPPRFSPVRHSSAAAGDGEPSATRGLVDSMAGAFEWARKAMAELQERERELQASRGEVAQHKEALRAANAQHAAEVGRLVEEHHKETAAHAADVARLEDELRTTEAAHAAEVARLAEELDKARADVHIVRDFYARRLRGLSELTTEQLLSNSGFLLSGSQL